MISISEISRPFVQVDRVRTESGKTFGQLAFIEEVYPTSANPSKFAEIPQGTGDYYPMFAKGIMEAARRGLPLVTRDFGLAVHRRRPTLVPINQLMELSPGQISETTAYTLDAIETEIKKTSLEDLSDPKIAARLGLAWAENNYRFESIVLTGFLKVGGEESENSIKIRNHLIEKIQEIRDAVLDARDGHFTYLKELIADQATAKIGSDIGNALRGLDLCRNLLIIALAMPNEAYPDSTAGGA